MNQNFTKSLIFALLVFFSATTKAQQSTIYNEDFNTHVAGTYMQAGWTTNPVADTSSWHTDSSAANVSTGYTGASGSWALVVKNLYPTGVYTLISKPISTIGYNNVTVIWGSRNSTNFPSTGSSIQSVSWSTDGTNWTNIAYTPNTNNSTWALENAGVPISLPAAAFHASSLQIKWVANIVNGANGTYRIDDFNVSGHLDGTSVNEIFKNENFCLFNYGGKLNVVNTASHLLYINIYNMTGDVIKSVVSSDPTITISVANLPSALYISEVDDKVANERKTLKFFVQ